MSGLIEGGNYPNLNSMKSQMRKCLKSVDRIRNDQPFIYNEELIVDQLTKIWAALQPKPASMLKWAESVYDMVYHSDTV